MGLNSALVDRARVVRKAPSGVRVEGRTIYGETRGPWFRCRLSLPVTPEQAAAAAGVREVLRAPQIMFGTLDEDGGDVAVSIDQRLEIDSTELGTATWDVVSAPEVIRKKRRVIGFQATVRRLEESG